MTSEQIVEKHRQLCDQRGGDDGCLQVVIARLPAPVRAPGSIDTTCDICDAPCCYVEANSKDACQKYGFAGYVKMCQDCLSAVVPHDANPQVLHNYHAAKDCGVSQAQVIEVEKALARMSGAEYLNPAENN